MIISFFGHSDYTESEGDEDKVLSLLENSIKDCPVEFYLGGYGHFDSFALRACNKYKETHGNAKTVFVTPYIDENYYKLKYANDIYDDTIYPPLETVPKKFVISKRNQWMVDQADMIIAYITTHYGGTYSALIYAKRKKKPFINIFSGKYEL